MAKKNNSSGLTTLVSLVAWLTGVIVSLAVGFALIGGTLTVPILDSVPYLIMAAGWIVVATTLLGVILAIVDYFS